MATKKKAKAKTRTKPKKKKRVAKRPLPKKKKTARKAKKVARRKVVKKKAAKKKSASRKKPAAKKKKPAARRIARAAPAKPSSAVTALPGEVRVGVVTHYFSHLSVAVLKIESGVLREGDSIHIKGHTSDFRQRVASMEVDHVHVAEARAGQSVGLKVTEHAREHDVVFRMGM